MGKKKTTKDISIKVVNTFSALIGKPIALSLVDTARKMDDPKVDPKDFLDDCKAAFSELLGEDIAYKKLRPLYAASNRGVKQNA